MDFAYHGQHPVFSQPPGETKLWRYVNLPKLVSMLETRSLHFARTDTLDDPFEGSWTKNHAPFVLVEKGGVPVVPQPPQEELEARARGHETPEMRAICWKNRRECTAVNCWYVGAHESAAMWRLYASEGIVIQTTFDDFVGCFRQAIPGDGTSPIYVGLVRYVDYATAIMPVANGYWPFIHKRLSFEHEREIRAVIHEFGKDMVKHGNFEILEPGVPLEGFSVPIDVNRLIHSVRVAPSSPKWFVDAVCAVARAFGYNFAVEQSQLDATPFH